MAALSTLALAALTAAGTASSFAAQRKNGDATELQGDYEAQLLEQDAALAKLQSADVLTRGRQAELTARGQTRQLVGAQRNALAAQGIDLDTGSAGDVQAESNAIGAFDALTIQNNVRREAWGYDVQAADYRNKAALTRAGARNLAGAQRAGATGTLLGGAASLASQARTWRKG